VTFYALSADLSVRTLSADWHRLLPRPAPTSGRPSSPRPARTLPPASPHPTLSISPAPASSAPPDPLARAQRRECFTNDGTSSDPDLQQDAACPDGSFRVLQVLPGTTDTAACNWVTGDDWNIPDRASDQVLCLTYQDPSRAYHALAGDCVFGPPVRDSIWTNQPCQPGFFTVTARYRSTTDTGKCGAGPDYHVSFKISGYRRLDEVLCLQMSYPPVDTAPPGNCLWKSGPPGNVSFSQASCSYANAEITSRIFAWDNPGFCWPYGAFWWDPDGYPSLGVTTCFRLLS
jgi:hypothetical protein